MNGSGDLGAVVSARDHHTSSTGGEAAGRLLAHARAHGTVTAVDLLDPGEPDMLAWVADALPHVDHFLPNDEQLRGLTGLDDLTEACHALLERGVGHVAVTAGADGAVLGTAPTRDAIYPRGQLGPGTLVLSDRHPADPSPGARLYLYRPLAARKTARLAADRRRCSGDLCSPTAAPNVPSHSPKDPAWRRPPPPLRA